MPITLRAINTEYFPLNFFAALGVQQVLNRSIQNPNQIKLHWVSKGQGNMWTAVISGVESMQDLNDFLSQAARDVAKDPVWCGIPGASSDGINNVPVEAARIILQAEAHTRTGRRWAGLVTEWPDDAQKEKKKKKTKDQEPRSHNDPSDEESTSSHEKVTKSVRVMHPSRLHMLSGDQQSGLFLRFIRDAAQAATKPNAFDEALQGPWQFEDRPTSKGNGWDATSLGWYANQRGWAYSGTKPEDIRKSTVSGVMWLAAEGLTSLPTWAGGKHPRTTAVGKEALLCPLWTVPLSLAAVEYLLRSISETPEQSWYQRGVAAILKCEKGTVSSKYYHAWFPPRVI